MEPEANLSSYVASVGCVNCGHEGMVELPVGKSIWEGICPLCMVSGRLRPNNEFFKEEKSKNHLF